MENIKHMKLVSELCFASFLSDGFITAIVVNSLERKLAKRTSVQWVDFFGMRCVFTLFHTN